MPAASTSSSIEVACSRLSRAITAYPAELDYVFIDCPPSLGLLTVNALVAAQEVLIPIQCEYYALEGLSALLNTRAALLQDSPTFNGGQPQLG